MSRRTAATATKSQKSPAESKAAGISLVADREAEAMRDADLGEPPSKGDADAGIDKGLGKRELIDRVVIASGIKKKAAKPVVEALLKELGDALSRGETLNLQPFGKANVKRRKEVEHAEIIEMRLRRSKLAIKAAEAAAETSIDPLADSTE